MMKQLLYIICFLSFCHSVSAQQVEWGNWIKWGDQGDGTYMNPIIPSDYSDIDCIKVGDDYYAISSTFQFSPGMTLLHSKDLVNWEICGNIIDDLTQIGPDLGWERMNRYARGVWAGTLRFHNNRFYLFFGTPDEGYFMTSAARPEGPWEPLTCLLGEAGWDDCTVMWDDNGEACFVGTHFADGYKTYIFRMSADGKTIDRSSALLVNSGNGREANKLIKVCGWYYLVFSEYKPGVGRYVMARRSRNMFGPYTEEKQLALPSCEAMEPNQGGIVEGKNGKWYFLTHHGSGDWSGRIVSLLPVTWLDGWPIIGKPLQGNIGTMVWKGNIPSAEGSNLFIRRSDDFDDARLAPQWQWNYQPRQEMYSLSERAGWLRLKAYRPLKPNSLMLAGNTLTQRSFRKPVNKVVVKLDISAMSDGQKCGLCHFSSRHAAIGIVMEEGVKYIEYRVDDQVQRGPQVSAQYVWLKSEWGTDGLSRFGYSFNGELYEDFGAPYQMVWGNYRGDRLGIYCFNDIGEDGYVDVDYFHYE